MGNKSPKQKSPSRSGNGSNGRARALTSPLPRYAAAAAPSTASTARAARRLGESSGGGSGGGGGGGTSLPYEPTGLYPTCSWSIHSVRAMVTKQQIAPRYKGVEDEKDDWEECPICFNYYPGGLNRAKCCKGSICTECFLQVQQPDMSKPCPFCEIAAFTVHFQGPLEQAIKQVIAEDRAKLAAAGKLPDDSKAVVAISKADRAAMEQAMLKDTEKVMKSQRRSSAPSLAASVGARYRETQGNQDVAFQAALSQLMEGLSVSSTGSGGGGRRLRRSTGSSAHHARGEWMSGQDAETAATLKRLNDTLRALQGQQAQEQQRLQQAQQQQHSGSYSGRGGATTAARLERDLRRQQRALGRTTRAHLPPPQAVSAPHMAAAAAPPVSRRRMRAEEGMAMIRNSGVSDPNKLQRMLRHAGYNVAEIDELMFAEAMRASMADVEPADGNGSGNGNPIAATATATATATAAYAPVARVVAPPVAAAAAPPPPIRVATAVPASSIRAGAIAQAVPVARIVPSATAAAAAAAAAAAPPAPPSRSSRSQTTTQEELFAAAEADFAAAMASAMAASTADAEAAAAAASARSASASAASADTAAAAAAPASASGQSSRKPTVAVDSDDDLDAMFRDMAFNSPSHARAPTAARSTTAAATAAATTRSSGTTSPSSAAAVSAAAAAAAAAASAASAAVHARFAPRRVSFASSSSSASSFSSSSSSDSTDEF